MRTIRKILLCLLTFFIGKIQAQVCTGSLVYPTVTIDFGAGNNPGQPISNVPSTYQYTALDCPQEGFYAIRNSTFFCFNNDWHVVPYDHSPNDPVGYFLLVNALSGPSVVYIDTISGLCPNTVFELNAWIVNLLKPGGCSGNGIDPNLTLTVTDISGVVLKQYNTGNIAENDPVRWTAHNFLFTAPANGTVILKITSTAPNGCGNEFGIDDISFRPCGPDISISFPNNSIQPLSLCETVQQNILLTAASSNSYPNPRFQWQVSNDLGITWTDISGANGTNYMLTTPAGVGQYLYRCIIADASQINISSCLFSSNVLSIVISAFPSFVQATIYQYGCLGGTTYLFASGGLSFEWTGPNGFYSTDQRPMIDNLSYQDTGLYTVKVTNVGGCADYASVFLPVFAAPVATLSPTDVSICEGDSVQLFAGGSLHYQWLPPAGLSDDTIPNPFAKPQNTTTYNVRVYNAYSCYDTANVKVTVWKKPKAFAGPDKFLLKGKKVLLEGGIAGSNVSYNWSPPDYLDNPLLVQPKAGPTVTTTYRLTVTSNKGCGTSTDDVKVEVVDKLFIPTAFTPNSDGLNDKWEITIFEEYPKATVEVFNRWGQIVYRGFGNNYKPWDGNHEGKLALPGVYVYVVNLHNNTAILKGTLLLIR
ncbi:MAG: gliding motility-associated C-terminal domain-containing protein [Chitinophagaceae bacterium]|nr:MAG: gliding motility-associated C-terminal domain-containing protein [Chitinophagaceae bacterium]